MKTTSPISTISYNSKEFLLNTLKELEDNGTISSWFCIYHFAEADEAKHHWHVWIKPNSRIDTKELTKKHFEEIVPDNDKPLKCIDWEKSKIDDAILYFAHYKPYLAWKHQSRKHHYEWTCFYVSDPDWFEWVLNHALTGSEFYERTRIHNVIIENTNTLSELITSGEIPINLASQVLAYSNLLDNDRVQRGKRKTHTPKPGDTGYTVTLDGVVGGGGVIIEK